jgi:uncharacterized protein YjbJ (UPF0337 family)
MGTLNEKYYQFKEPNQQSRTNDIVKSPQQSATDENTLSSQPQPRQQQQAMPDMDVLKGKWKQHVGSAKIAWGKLTEDELLKSEGHAQRLTGLVQERYAITHAEADKQVKSFIKKHKL